MSENPGTDRRSGPDAGLGATGRSAEDFRPGDEDKMASDYGDPGGIDTAVTQEESPEAVDPQG
jgi:hypothetical protein